MVKCDKTGVKSREIKFFFLVMDGQTRVGYIRRKLILLLSDLVLLLRFDAFQKRNTSFLDLTLESFLTPSSRNTFFFEFDDKFGSFLDTFWLHSFLIGGKFDLSAKGWRFFKMAGVGANGGFWLAEPKRL